MASLTVRNLDESTKENLRIIAAKNHRSMEEEARLALASYINSAAGFDKSIGTPVSTQKATGMLGEPFSGHLPELSSPAGRTAACAIGCENSDTVLSLQSKRILLIIGGGIAAYKSLDLIRRLRERGAIVRVVMTLGAQQFVTPLAAAALAGGQVFTGLFSKDNEQDIGHIRLSREADLIIVAPATASRLAKVANGIGDDLAGAILLASKIPVIFAPAMNPAMWVNAATQRNIATLRCDGHHFIEPRYGEMAEPGEVGRGRMAEPIEIAVAVEAVLNPKEQPLNGKHIIVTSGPTHEPIDPVRYIANRSSGKQGHAIAVALAALGARVTLVTGPVTLRDPPNVETIHVETAKEMLDAVKNALPAEAAIFVAAVADWRSESVAHQKIKKNSEGFKLALKENPDILATIGHKKDRPKLVVGFAAETDHIITNAQKKLRSKGADLIIVNDVSTTEDGKSVMGGDTNKVTLIDKKGEEQWPEMDKKTVAEKLAQRFAKLLNASK